MEVKKAESRQSVKSKSLVLTIIFEVQWEKKNGLLDFRTGLIKTDLYSLKKKAVA